MDSKQLARVEIKDAAKGEVEAVFATIGVIDKDNDVTNKGAFTDGAAVRISAFGHKSWEGALPVGSGTIQEVGNEAVFKGRFFMNTAAGRDTFEVCKEMSQDGGPGMEWSYGFKVDDSEQGTHDGKSVRFLKQMTVHEVSPVMIGAGVNTRTVGTKSLNEELAETVVAVKAAVESAKRVVALRAENGKELSKVNYESLDGLYAVTEELKALLTPQEEEDDEMEQIALSLIAEELE